jgi:hypothetical protein
MALDDSGYNDSGVDTLSLGELEQLSESEKNGEEYLHQMADYMIRSLNLNQKVLTEKAYRLKNGVRNPRDFEYITKQYGVEFPAKLGFTPLISRHLKVLQGQNDITELKYDVTCSDVQSIQKVEQEKKRKFLQELQRELSFGIKTNSKTPDSVLDELMKSYETEFKGDLEIDAKHMLEYIIQAKNIREKASIMFEDAFTAGEDLYQVKVIEEGIAPLIEAVNPLELFYEMGDKIFIKDCDRVVWRKKMLITDIINQYGNQIKKEQIEQLQTKFYNAIHQLELVDMRDLELEGWNSDFELKVKNAYEYVYYCEWKSNNKVKALSKGVVEKGKERKDKYRLDRYEQTKIGEDIWADGGKSKYIQREEDNPYYCTLTINGMCYNARNGRPYSMFLATENLQNDYDIYRFHQSNMVALSGSKAMYLPLEAIPLSFGTNETDRIIKAQHYAKNGFIFLATSQEGAGTFQNYGQAVDLTLGSGADSITNMLRFIEETASLITGVSPQALSQISQNDGLGTTKIALNQTALVTQPLHTMHRAVLREMFNDILNACRICYPDGLTASYTLGVTKKAFSIGKEYKASRYNVFINNTGLESKQMDDLKMILPEIIRAGEVDTEVIIDIATVTSLTEMKRKIKESMKSAKGKKLQELEQQLEQANNELKKLTGQLQQYQKNDQQLEGQRVQIEKEKADTDSEFKQAEVSVQREKNEIDRNYKEKLVELEGQQIIYSNQNLEVSNAK